MSTKPALVDPLQPAQRKAILAAASDMGHPRGLHVACGRWLKPLIEGGGRTSQGIRLAWRITDAGRAYLDRIAHLI